MGVVWDSKHHHFQNIPVILRRSRRISIEILPPDQVRGQNDNQNKKERREK